jgi:hypothetical protein
MCHTKISQENLNYSKQFYVLHQLAFANSRERSADICTCEDRSAAFVTDEKL